jgi:hypothetical protein
MAFVLLVGRVRLVTPKLRFRTRDQGIKRAVLMLIISIEQVSTHYWAGF